MKTMDEIRHMYADKKLDKHGFELMAKHYEEKRREKVRVCIEVSDYIYMLMRIKMKRGNIAVFYSVNSAIC